MDRGGRAVTLISVPTEDPATDGTTCLVEVVRRVRPLYGGNDDIVLARAVQILTLAVQTHRRYSVPNKKKERNTHSDAANIQGEKAGLSDLHADEAAALRWFCAQPIAWHSIDAHWLGRAYQCALDEIAGTPQSTASKSRRSKGIFYTPPALVSHLLDQTLTQEFLDSKPIPVILDPSCGCGAFLVEALRRLRSLRPDMPRATLLRTIHGMDIDPLAVQLCRLALWLELGDSDATRLTTADTLLEPPGMETVDLLLGNPPFLSQVARATARSRADAHRLRARFGHSLRPYTDPAALFLQLGIESLRPGGRLGMVLPVSILASRDAAVVRQRVARNAVVRSLWLDTEGIFPASVHTVAMTFERTKRPRPFRRFVGLAETEKHAPVISSTRVALHEAEDSWGALAASLVGVPDVRLPATQTLETCCEITAGFRDEYYAIAKALCELPSREVHPAYRVATVGLIDPAYLAWGKRPIKIARQSWDRPGVMHHGDDPVLRSVLSCQARPKVLVATQSKVLEAAADHRGEYLALTPTIMVYPKETAETTESIWKYGALLCSPVLSAWIAARSFGTARSLHAIKPSAALLRNAPLPIDLDAWQAAAREYREASMSTCHQDRMRALLSAAESSCWAYGIEQDVATQLIDWWKNRLPTPKEESTERPRQKHSEIR